MGFIWLVLIIISVCIFFGKHVWKYIIKPFFIENGFESPIRKIFLEETEEK
jgi:hypothetical protein